jgi:hypothetical protein
MERRGAWGGVALEAGREVQDVGDEPLIAPLLNSFAAQELGQDHGDYVLRDRARMVARKGIGAMSLEVAVARELTQSLAVRAAPVTGTYRPNFPLGAGRYWTAELGLRHRGWVLPPRPETQLDVVADAGLGDSSAYVRLRGAGRVEVALARTSVRLAGWAGWGSRDLRGDKAFLWGGRGAEGCEATGRCGGRYGAGGGVEWRVRIPFPGIPLGGFGSTGRELVLAPFLRGAWLAGQVRGAPWSATDGLGAVVGVGVEWLHQLIRVELAVDPRTGRLGLVADLHRGLWPLL